MEELSPDLHRLCDVHQFPVSSTGPCSRLLVTVASLPRLSSIPALPSSSCGGQKSPVTEDTQSTGLEEFKTSPDLRGMKDRGVASQRSLRSKQDFRPEDSNVSQENVKDASRSQKGKGNVRSPRGGYGEDYSTTSQRMLRFVDNSDWLAFSTVLEPENKPSCPKAANGKAVSDQTGLATMTSDFFASRKDFSGEGLDEVASLASSLDSHSTLSSFDESLITSRDSGPDIASLPDVHALTSLDWPAAQSGSISEKSFQSPKEIARMSGQFSKNLQQKSLNDVQNQIRFSDSGDLDNFTNNTNNGLSFNAVEEIEECVSKGRVLQHYFLSQDGQREENGGSKNSEGVRNQIQGKLFDNDNRGLKSHQRALGGEECRRYVQCEGAEETRKPKSRVTKKDGEKDMRIEQRKDLQESMGNGRNDSQQAQLLTSDNETDSITSSSGEWQKPQSQENRQKKRQRKQRQQQLRRQKQKQQQQQFHQFREQQQRQQQQLQRKGEKDVETQPPSLNVLSSKTLRLIPLEPADMQGREASFKKDSPDSLTQEDRQSGNRTRRRRSNTLKGKSVEHLHTLTQQEVSEEEFIRRLSDRLSAVPGQSQAWKCEYAQELRDEMFSKEEAAMRKSRKEGKTEKSQGQEWLMRPGDVIPQLRCEKLVIGRGQISRDADVLTSMRQEKYIKRNESKSSNPKPLQDLAVNTRQNEKLVEPKASQSQESLNLVKDWNKGRPLRSVAKEVVVSSFQQLSIDIDSPSASKESHSRSTRFSPLASSKPGLDSSSSSSSDTTPVASPRPNSAQGDGEVEGDRPEAKVKSSVKSLVKVVGQKLARKALSSQGAAAFRKEVANDVESKQWDNQEKLSRNGCEETGITRLQDNLESFLGQTSSKSHGSNQLSTKDLSLSQLGQLTTVECTNIVPPSISGPSVTRTGTSTTVSSCCISISSPSTQSPAVIMSNSQGKANIPIPQTNSRRIFQENLLPIMSYDASSDSFKSVGGDWPAWQHDSGNYHDSACPHHEQLPPESSRERQAPHSSQPVLHSPKVLFSSDLPSMGFNMDGSEELVARMLLPRDADDSSHVDWDIIGLDFEDHHSLGDVCGKRKSPEEESSKGDSQHPLTSSNQGTPVRGRHAARRQLDYSRTQSGSPDSDGQQQEYCKDNIVQGIARNGSAVGGVEGSRTTSGAIDIAPLQKSQGGSPTADLTHDKSQSREFDHRDQKEIKGVSAQGSVQPENSNKCDLQSQHHHHQQQQQQQQLPPKLSPQLARVLSLSSSPASSTSSSSSSTSSVRLVATSPISSTKPPPQAGSPSSMLSSLLSVAQETSSVKEPQRVSSCHPSPPSLSLSSLSSPTSKAAESKHTALSIPEVSTFISTSHTGVVHTQGESLSGRGSSSSSSLSNGSKPNSLSASGDQNYISQQPLPRPLPDLANSDLTDYKSQGALTGPSVVNSKNNLKPKAMLSCSER